MGATDFMAISRKDNIEEAFTELVKEAQYEYGHSGYTGTIAEKTKYVIVSRTALPDAEASIMMQGILDEYTHACTDKWGPAGAIKLEEGGWLFFGVAAE